MRPTWLPAVVVRIRELAAQRKVQFTLKALRELAELDIGLDEEDACDVLANLAPSEFAEWGGLTGLDRIRAVVRC